MARQWISIASTILQTVGDACRSGSAARAFSATICTTSRPPSATRSGASSSSRVCCLVIGQANNAFVFPGIGLGTMVAEARRVSDGMLAAAARALADEVRDEHLDASSLFPAIASLRRVTARVAGAVVAAARDEGLGRALPDDAISDAVDGAMWTPDYPELVPV